MHAVRSLTFAVITVLLVGCSGSAEQSDVTPPGRSDPSTTSPSTASTTAPGVSGSGSPSAGCAGTALEPGRSLVTVRSGGRDRTYVRYVPNGLAGSEPAALVIDFPAYSPASVEEQFSGFTKARPDGTVPADGFGAVVVTPEPVNGAGALLTWNYVGTDGWTDDQRFVSDLLDNVEATACIDTDRVLATGFAVGAVFASILTCQQADRIAVLATVSGLYRPEGCDASVAVPVVSFHGTGDRFIPFDGSVGSGVAGLGLSAETTAGLGFMVTRPGALDSSMSWAELDGCEAESSAKTIGSGGADGVTRKTWSGCDHNSDVELYVIDGGEHTWPGSTGMGAFTDLLGPVSDSIDATQIIWDFFEAHTR